MTAKAPLLPFELGCNYWPKSSAMYMWRMIDGGEIRDDFAHMRDMGFRVVRLFLLTEDFLLAPMSIAESCLHSLLQIARIAEDEKIAIIPTLITINMSGKMWWPPWMLDANKSPNNIYSDPTLLKSQIHLVGACARALSGGKSIRAYDLTNEIDDALALPSRDAGWLWTSLLSHAIRNVSPDVPIQFGAHLPSLTTHTHFRIDDLASVVDEDCMHAYPLYCDAARSFLDPELVPFSCALTSALSGRHRPTLMHEFGICTAPQGTAGQTIMDQFLGRSLPQYLASEEEGALYYHDVLDRLAATGASGAYAWCYGDYHPSLFQSPPFDTALRERSFGLVRADGSEKPVVDVMRRFASRLLAGNVSFGPVPQTLDVTAEEYYASPDRHFRRLYARWLAR